MVVYRCTLECNFQVNGQDDLCFHYRPPKSPGTTNSSRVDKLSELVPQPVVVGV